MIYYRTGTYLFDQMIHNSGLWILKKYLRILNIANAALEASVPDPGSGAFLTPGSRIRCLFDPWIQDG